MRESYDFFLGFHIAYNFLAAIAQKFQESREEDIFTEPGPDAFFLRSIPHKILM